MQISLLCMGKTDESEIRALIEKYEKRLPRSWNFERIEIPDIKNRKNLNQEQQKIAEYELFLQKITPSDYLILLDEKGKQLTSVEFAQKIQQWQLQSIKKVIFVIGGPYGFTEEMHKMAHQKMSLSKMTFTHQMVRLFFVEQLYRADSILKGKSYHHS